MYFAKPYHAKVLGFRAPLKVFTQARNGAAVHFSIEWAVMMVHATAPSVDHTPHFCQHRAFICLSPTALVYSHHSPSQKIPLEHQHDAKYLRMALAMAQRGRGFCAPNPAVGAVLVHQDQVIAQGTHQACGAPHAEQQALSQKIPQGSVLYVTLEPCAHQGKTPPCIDLIKKKQVARVVYGFKDPNTTVAGHGAQKLHNWGIPCDHLPLKPIQDFYQSYQFWLETQRPWVSAKIAMSLDGKIAGPEGQPVSITGKALNQYTQQHRYHSDALLTTSRTIIMDNPKLNARVPEGQFSKPIYVMDRSLSTPLSAQIFDQNKVTLYHTAEATPQRIDAVQAAGKRCIPIEGDDYPSFLRNVLGALGKDGIHDVWVEAGGFCFHGLITAHLVHTAYLYVGNLRLGNQALSLTQGQRDYHHLLGGASCQHWGRMGQDQYCQAHFGVDR